MTDRINTPKSKRRSARRLVAALLLSLPVAGIGLTATAYAQQAQGQGEQKQETTQAQVLTEKTFKQLTEANKAIEENRYKDAQPILDRLLGDEKLTPYERAVVLQTRGFLATEQEDLKGGARFFEQALRLNILPPDQQQSLVFNLAQLFLATEQFQKSIDMFKEWFAVAQNPRPEAYVAFGSAYAQMERYKDAIPLFEKALELSDNPKREWYDVLAGLYFETKQYAKVAEILELLVSRHPAEKRYYTQLAGIYSELNRQKDMLAIMEAAYKAGHLDKSNEFVQLAQLWMFHEVPYRAAVLLEKQLEAGKIENKKENWELLANAWVASREIPKSIKPLERAAELSSDGEGFIRLAQAYLEREDWKSAYSALEKGLAKGKVQSPGQAYLLEGVALFNLDRLEDSRKAFRKAAEFKDQQRSARQWMGHIEKLQAAEAERLAQQEAAQPAAAPAAAQPTQQ